MGERNPKLLQDIKTIGNIYTYLTYEHLMSKLPLIPGLVAIRDLLTGYTIGSFPFPSF